MNKKISVAVREIEYCLKQQQVRKRLIIRIAGPYLVDAGDVNFRFDEGTAGCTIEFDGLNEDNIEVFGMDALHALTLAIDVDPYLKSMSKKYDFYWLTGEDYFD